MLTRAVLPAAALAIAVGAAGDAGAVITERPPLTRTAQADPVVAAAGDVTAVAWLSRRHIHVRHLPRGRRPRARGLRLGRTVDVDAMEVAVGPSGQVAVSWLEDDYTDESCGDASTVTWRVALLRPGSRRLTRPDRIAGPWCDLDGVTLFPPGFTPGGRLYAVWDVDAVRMARIDRGGRVRSRRAVFGSHRYYSFDSVDFTRSPPRPVITIEGRGSPSINNLLRVVRPGRKPRMGKPLLDRRDFNGDLLLGFDRRGLTTFTWNNNDSRMFGVRRVEGRLHGRILDNGTIFESDLATSPSGGALSAWQRYGARRERVKFSYAAPGRGFARNRTLLKGDMNAEFTRPGVALGPHGSGVITMRTGEVPRVHVWSIGDGRVLRSRRYGAEQREYDPVSPAAAVDDRSIATVAWESKGRIRLLRGWIP